MKNENYNQKVTGNEIRSYQSSGLSWNWAAFSLPVIWGLFHGVLWPIGIRCVIFIVSNVLGVYWVDNPDIQTKSIIFFSTLFNLVLSIYMGLRADKIGDFTGCSHEKGWQGVGIVCSIVVFISVVYAIMIFPSLL